MAEGPNRVRIEEIDWQATLPFTHLFGSFRMAIHPMKIVLALAMIILLYLCGTLMDAIFFSHVYPDERENYEEYVAFATDPQDRTKAKTPVEFRRERRAKNMGNLSIILSGDQLPGTLKIETLKLDVPKKTIKKITEAKWPYALAIEEINNAFAEVYNYRTVGDDGAEQEDEENEDEDGKQKAQEEEEEEDALQKAERRARLIQERRFLIGQVKQMQPKGVFAAAVEFKLECLTELAQAAANLNLGLGELLPGDTKRPALTVPAAPSVVGTLRKLIIDLPAWLYTYHFWFVVFFGAIAFVVWALLGGAIARLAALHATRDERVSSGEALSFGAKRWVWFFLAPLIPVAFGLLVALIMVAGGFLFNIEVVEWLAALLFFLALAGGLVITLLLVGLVGGCNLLYPAIAVEGTDAFDAISRAFNYVIGRPWRMIFYNLVALVYGAITYTFLSVVVYLVLAITHGAVGTWVFRDEFGVNRFEAMMPRPTFGNLMQNVDWYALNWSSKVAAVMVSVWSWLAVAFLAAFAVSFYFSASTWVYLLLRRAADGTEYDDVYIASTESEPGAVDDALPPPTETGDASTSSDEGENKGEQTP